MGQGPLAAEVEEGEQEAHSEEDLMGDQSWARTNEGEFSQAVDDMFAGLRAELLSGQDWDSHREVGYDHPESEMPSTAVDDQDTGYYPGRRMNLALARSRSLASADGDAEQDLQLALALSASETEVTTSPPAAEAAEAEARAATDAAAAGDAAARRVKKKKLSASEKKSRAACKALGRIVAELRVQGESGVSADAASQANLAMEAGEWVIAEALLREATRCPQCQRGRSAGHVC